MFVDGPVILSARIRFAMNWMDVIFLLLLTTNPIGVRGYEGCSSAYGSKPCSFVPAPPGKTPPCARPGLTFCEHPDHYPQQLINYLIQKWRFDHSTLIASESREEFSSYLRPTPSPVYGPPNYHSYGPPNHHSYGPPTYQGSGQGLPDPIHIYHGSGQDARDLPEPIHIPKPPFPFHDGGKAYVPPKAYPLLRNFTEGSGGQYDLRYPDSLSAYSERYQPQGYFTPSDAQYNPYIGDVWKRIESNYQRLRRSLKHQRKRRSFQRITEESKHSNSTLQRSKRQATIPSLCRVRSQFIMPRAALNNKGNWMYVVNMPEVDSSYTQLVKSEVCASQTCNGICSLPEGYSSRCEQKYVQKRLVALEAGGNQLYNDVFWFPSCCICAISRN
ncbi:unnamed protein product [Phaedon cochleariae]|uniref:Spaetzle domain-containing protein n=1 Tax=Phaedon cochleariae TaxID=80249 RepID=A0A9N9SK29_PHACE|nr:unnamed protein product [Phaedon cochleariae]